MVTERAGNHHRDTELEKEKEKEKRREEFITEAQRKKEIKQLSSVSLCLCGESSS